MPARLPRSVRFDLPPWLTDEVAEGPRADAEARMALAVDLARRNVAAGTGGPFGAVVFEQASGHVVAVGVNLVPARGLSVLHAEVVALTLAQERLGTFDLAAEGAFQLVASCDPCAMCAGAVPWSGVAELVCGARTEDAEAAGFEEGGKPPGWVRTLEERGVRVVRDVLRDEAAAVLAAYARAGGVVYNSRRGARPPR